jgi:hypothetical protein
MYDTAPDLEAFAPPTLVHEGVTYTGRHVSILEWFTWTARLERAAEGKASVAELLVLYRQLCDLFFPPPPRVWWAPWRRRGGVRVADLVAGLPLEVQHRVIASFLQAQARGLGVKAPGPMTTTASSSPPSKASPTGSSDGAPSTTSPPGSAPSTPASPS